MPEVDLQPDDETVEQYYEQLAAYENVGARHEGPVRTAFRDLLDHGGKQMGWKLVPTPPNGDHSPVPVSVTAEMGFFALQAITNSR